MTQSDNEILELLANEPAPPLRLTPKVIAANVSVSRPTVQRRLGRLLDAGLVEKVLSDEYDGLYEITELGQRYLAGDADASELQLRAIGTRHDVGRS